MNDVSDGLVTSVPSPAENEVVKVKRVRSEESIFKQKLSVRLRKVVLDFDQACGDEGLLAKARYERMRFEDWVVREMREADNRGRKWMLQHLVNRGQVRETVLIRSLEEEVK